MAGLGRVRGKPKYAAQVEIIGNAGDEPRSSSGTLAVDLDASGSEEAAGHAGRHSVLGVAVAALLSAEALGLAGLVVELLSVGLITPFIAFQEDAAAQSVPGGSQYHPFGVVGWWTLGVGAAGFLLGLLALLRLGPAPTLAGRTLAGAATVVGLLMVAVSVWLLTITTLHAGPS